MTCLMANNLVTVFLLASFSGNNLVLSRLATTTTTKSLSIIHFQVRGWGGGGGGLLFFHESHSFRATLFPFHFKILKIKFDTKVQNRQTLLAKWQWAGVRMSCKHYFPVSLIPLSNQLHRGTSPVKVFEFYGLVDQGKYRNTFQTDLSYPGKLPWWRIPRISRSMCRKYKVRLQGAGFGYKGARNYATSMWNKRSEDSDGSKINVCGVCMCARTCVCVCVCVC